MLEVSSKLILLEVGDNLEAELLLIIKHNEREQMIIFHSRGQIFVQLSKKRKKKKKLCFSDV